MQRIRIRAELCKRCGRCVEICPEQLFLQPDPRAAPRIPRQKGCILCGHCVTVCRAGAIVHPDFPVDERFRVEE